MATTTSIQASALRRLLQGAVTGDGDSMAALVTVDVTGWSPNCSSRRATSCWPSWTAARTRSPESRSVSRCSTRSATRQIAEWHMAADHTGALAVDDDRVIEPTGRRLPLSGATVAEFDGEHICAFRSYFDDLALIEQVLADE